jgi:hypothetical protein
MAFRLVTSGGSVQDAAMINMRASGIVRVGGVVNFSRTAGAGVDRATSASTGTMIFGVSQSYVQGASDAEALVIPFTPGQLWEADCTDAVLTAQIGLRHVLNDDLLVRNTSTDLGAGTTNSAVFRAVAITGLLTGSGKLIGYFRPTETNYPTTDTTFV